MASKQAFGLILGVASFTACGAGVALDPFHHDPPDAGSFIEPDGGNDAIALSDSGEALDDGAEGASSTDAFSADGDSSLATEDGGDGSFFTADSDDGTSDGNDGAADGDDGAAASSNDNDGSPSMPDGDSDVVEAGRGDNGIFGGAIVSAGGKCLSAAPLADPSGQHSVQLRTCTGEVSQIWTRDQNGRLLPRGSPGGALRVQGELAVYGVAVQVSAIGEPPSLGQQWGFEQAQLRGLGERCLHVPNANFAVGQQVQFAPCPAVADLEGTAVDSWTITLESQIRHELSSTVISNAYCLDVPDSVDFVGKQMQVYPCNGGDNQKFSFSGGEIGYAGRCLEVESVPDAWLLLALCNSSPAQLFHARGRIKSGFGSCIDAGDGAEGSTPQVEQCSSGASAASQIWDWYP